MGTVSAEVLRAARAMLGLDQADVARLAGVARATVNRIEKGEKNVAIEYIERVQNALEAQGIDFIGNGEVTGEGLRWAKRTVSKTKGIERET